MSVDHVPAPADPDSPHPHESPPTPLNSPDSPLPPAGFHNRIETNHGQAVNVGHLNGDVNLHERPDYREFLGELATRRLRHAARIGADRIRDVRLTFHAVDRRAYETFAQALGRNRPGLIIGEPGNGRTHTAVHALTEPAFQRSVDSESATGPPDDSVEPRVDEVIIDPDEPDAGLAGITLDSDHPRFLDLSGLPEPTRSQSAAVRALVEQAISAGALLVVIIRSGPWEDELLACRARLRLDTPVQAKDVFNTAMGHFGQARFVPLWLRVPGVEEALSSPERAARLIREVDRARPLHVPEDGPGHLIEQEHRAWIDRALKGFGTGGGPLPGWSTSSRQEEEEGGAEFRRVLIQTVALLQGAPSDVIAEQSRRLARSWGVETPHPTPVSGDGFSRLLSGIGAEIQYGHVGFSRKDHWWEALDLLWREYPGARTTFQGWGHGAAVALTKRTRVAVARRWLALARHHRDPAPVLSLLGAWGGSGLMWAAAPAVAEAAVSPEIGAEVRTHLYRIATTSQPDQRYLLAMETCRIYGRVQPRTALTRLRHLADRVPRRWNENLFQALGEITREPGNLRTVLEVLPEWLDGKEQARAIAVRFLTDLLSGEADVDLPELVESRETPSGLVARVWWTAGPSLPETPGLLWDWLDTLAGLYEQRRGGVLFDCLATAATMDPGFADTLAGVARRWSVSHTRSCPPVEHLLRLTRTGNGSVDDEGETR